MIKFSGFYFHSKLGFDHLGGVFQPFQPGLGAFPEAKAGGDAFQLPEKKGLM